MENNPDDHAVTEKPAVDPKVRSSTPGAAYPLPEDRSPGLRRCDGYWLWVGGPVPPGSAGITLGPVVCVRKRSAHSTRLLKHELVHVRQWKQLGVVGFLWRYLGSYFRSRLKGLPHQVAYRKIPLEAEADWESRVF